MSDPSIKWPGEANPEGPWGAEEVMRWLAYEGLFCNARSYGLLPRDMTDDLAMMRYRENVARFQYAHDLYLALDALREVDPAKADEVAHRTVLAAVAGDSYGEWLWEWADGCGLDADAICEASRDALAVELGDRDE